MYPSKIIYLPFFLVISSLSQWYWHDISYLLVAIMLYSVLFKNDSWHLLLNTILLTSLLRLISEIVAKAMQILLPNQNIFIVITLNILIKLVIAVIFIFLYQRFSFKRNWQLAKSNLISYLLAYLFVVIYLFMHLIQQINADLLASSFLFIMLQIAFIVILFLKTNQTQRLAYRRELTKDQLHNLKLYTDQLEKDQLHLRKFERNYKNIFTSLQMLADKNDYQAINESLHQLEIYSNSYFDNISMQLFKDLGNVQNPYLKSLLISKLTLISQNKINCQFECRDVVNQVAIDVFDLVRLLGISIDNAIEATKQQENGEIQIAIVQNGQLIFLINNTITDKVDLQTMMQSGYTTKKNHSGFGMVNIQEIQKKYPNLFIQYHQINNQFKLSIQITKEGELN
ncbi:GHKL domain-containing protein [Companilactobacillus sp. HBUAS59544]|uniref:GHKL domain-containing protein n=1 Tax=Companilactobacillus sp. HBUAS59544 TaxID=3109363 RepID=UPI002FEE6D8E